MDVKLVVEKGPTRTRSIKLRGEKTVIGRTRGCNIRIPASEVSRRHCQIRLRDGYVTIEDLGSSNGTILNGGRIEKREVVRPGDRIKVGPLTFVVEYQLSSAALKRMLEDDDEEIDEFEVIEEPAEEPAEELPVLESEGETEPEPVYDLDSEEVLSGHGGGEGWQTPEADEFRDMLTGLEEEEAKPKKKPKKPPS